MKARLSLVLVVSLAFCTAGPAADWPQWRGPDRSGVSKETGLLKAWPKGGPKLLWTCRNAGLGFSGPAIVGDRLYTLGVRDEMTYVIAVDVTKGQEVWSTRIGPLFTFKSNSWGDGPRSTPTVDGDRLYALDATGLLVCLETAKGKEIWRKDLIKDLGGEMMTEWGYSESPLVDGGLLICTPGGGKGTLAALDQKTGAVKWRSTALKNKAPYSSIVISEAGGIRQYIQTSYINDEEGGVVSGFRAKDGKVLWSQSLFKDSKSYAIAPTPVVRDNLVYVTCNMGAPACHLFQLTRKGSGFAAKDLKPKTKLRNDHGGVVLIDDHIYGHSGGQGWMCQSLRRGKMTWLDRTQLVCQKSGSIVAADGRLYLFTDGGTVALVETNPEKWQESGRLGLPEKSTGNKNRPTGREAAIWTHPVVANGKLYLRDQELIFCYDVQEK